MEIIMAEYTTVRGSRVIRVSKVGGGTLGRKYEGDWEITVSDSGTVVLDDVITTGLRSFHEIADLAEDFVGDADEVE
jgi:orotate phosphoribosyltransferase